MQKTLLVAAAVFGISLVMFPSVLSAQADKGQVQKTDEPSQSQLIEHDVAARKKAFLSEKEDLDAMAKSFGGSEFSVAMALDDKAGQAAMYLDATVWFLAVYDNMQCDQDHEVAKTALKNRLSFYSHMLGLNADQTAGQLAFTKSPSMAQAGQRLKDDLRGARDKLDEINGSLK